MGGRGNCCGWYGAEYYKDTTLIAYGIEFVDYNAPHKYDSPYDGGFFAGVNKHYDEIDITGIYHEKRIKADSAEEAVKMFKLQK